MQQAIAPVARKVPLGEALTETKHKFLTLDGLRGVAAMAVVSMHTSDVLGGMVLPRAYLAVDLFFMMSGIVLAYAYEQRLAGGMTVRQFMLARIIRLYPLYILGTLLSILGIAAGLLGGISFELWTAPKLLWASIPALAMLPSYAAGFSTYYPLNGPTWSLMFELIVNFCYVLFFPRLTTRVLLTVMGLSLAGLADIALAGQTLDIGADWVTAYGGAPRVFWSFPAGVLLYRLLSAGRLPKIRIPAPVLMVGSLLIYAVQLPVGVVPLWDLFVIIILLPCIAFAAMTNEPAVGARIYAWLGLISYPVYMLHISAYHVLRKVVNKVIGAELDNLTPWIGLFLLAAIAIIGWAADALYDRPVRSWLQRRFLRRAPAREKVEPERDVSANETTPTPIASQSQPINIKPSN